MSADDLNSLLDENGLSERNVEKRRLREDMWSCILSGNGTNNYISGSVREGVVSAEDPQSDIDIMLIVSDIIVVNKRNRSSADIGNKVYVMQDSGNIGFKHVFNGHTLLTNDLFKVAIASTFTHNKASTSQWKTVIQGPAANVAAPDGSDDIDYVSTLKCRDFPIDAAEWWYRRRLYTWPPQNIINRIVSIGCHLVGVGSSPNRTDEWRLSFSFAENILIRSFNNTQLKCYALLKMILKSIIKPKIPGVLCSFHMKTTMFWMCEQTPTSFWVSERLHECIVDSIHHLRQCISSKSCPHYFMKSMNLFENKINASNNQVLLHIIDEMLEIPIEITLKEMLRQRLLLKSSSNFIPIDLIFLSATVRYFVQSAKDLNCGFSAEQDLVRYFFNLSSTIDVHLGIIKVCPNVFLFTKMCIHLANLLDSKNTNKCFNLIQRKLMKYLEHFSSFDVCAGKLKLATFYLRLNKVRKCLFLTKMAIRKMKDKCSRVASFFHFPYMFNLTKLVNEEWDNGLPNKLYSNFMVMDVVFLPAEIGLVPEAVQQEMIREKQYGPPVETVPTTCWCYYDPIIYAHYLLVICFHELGEEVNRDRSFRNLQGVFLAQRHSLLYREAASLLVDYCSTLCQLA